MVDFKLHDVVVDRTNGRVMYVVELVSESYVECEWFKPTSLHDSWWKKFLSWISHTERDLFHVSALCPLDKWRGR
jgi:uncharacterized protein YodC (DUF2158 family)